MDFTLTSTAFEEGQHIPRTYTGEDQDLSPPLKWFDPPPGTRSLALLCEDPDAPRGTFTHWIIYNLPAESRELAEGVLREEGFPNGTRQGHNDFGRVGYGGPKPPAGPPHHYRFRLFALNRLLDLPAGVGRDQFLEAMEGAVLAEAVLVGTYSAGEVHEIPDDPLTKKAQQDRGSIYTAPLA